MLRQGSELAFMRDSFHRELGERDFGAEFATGSWTLCGLLAAMALTHLGWQMSHVSFAFHRFDK